MNAVTTNKNFGYQTHLTTILNRPTLHLIDVTGASEETIASYILVDPHPTKHPGHAMVVTTQRTLRYFSLILGLAIVSAAAAPGQERPNLLVIMADDLGFSDLGCYGSEINTPNLDRLSAGGLRFTQFYNASRCCPTRAALLTGKYPHEVGLRTNGASLSLDAPTLAEIFRDNGYHTAMTGKWHLTHAAKLAGETVDSPEHLAVLNNQTRVKLFGEKATYPAARGFEHHYGVIWGIVNYFHPFALVDGFDPVYDLPKDFYLTDALNAKTAEYIRDFARDDKPFFMYLAHTAPHWPLHARAEDRAQVQRHVRRRLGGATRNSLCPAS